MSSPSPSGGRILLTNDDGLRSPGLVAVAEALQGIGEILVVAPREEMSAVGHAITLKGEIEVEGVDIVGAAAAYAVRGTPADSAKLAIRNLFADDPPALCVSGLNSGPNVGVNVFYSGTVAAALEAAVNGVPAVAVSKGKGERLTPSGAARLVAPLIREVLARKLPPWHILNVNVPDLPPGEIAGVKLTRHSVSGFVERYRERGGSPGAPVRRFSLEGDMRLRECDGVTDAEALAEGFVSVTPMALDLTARSPCAPSAEWGWIAAAPLGRG